MTPIEDIEMKIPDQGEAEIVRHLISQGYEPTQIMELVSSGEYDEIGIRGNFLNALCEIDPFAFPGAPSRDDFTYIPGMKLFHATKKSHLGKSWEETHGLLVARGERMQTIPEFRQSSQYFGKSKNPLHKRIYSEIFATGGNWRASRLDAYFKQRQDGLYILTGNKTKEEKLESCLMENRLPGINFDRWISGIEVTSQGLPQKNVAKGNLYYGAPRDGAVAWFVAGSGGAVLYCNRDPSGGLSVLGVYAVIDAGSLVRGQEEGK